MKLPHLHLGTALAALLGVPLLLAQSQQVTINATVAEVLNLSVDSTTVSLAFAAADYDATSGQAVKTALRATTFGVSANRDWRLTARPGDLHFSFTPSGTAQDPRKPVSTLAIRTGTNDYVPFAGDTELTVATGTRGGYANPGNSIPVDYQMTSALDTDPPGTYRLTLTYTLVAR